MTTLRPDTPAPAAGATTDLLLLTQALPYQVASHSVPQSFKFVADRFEYKPMRVVTTSPAPVPGAGKCRGVRAPCWTRADPQACCKAAPEGCDRDCSRGMYLPVGDRHSLAHIPLVLPHNPFKLMNLQL